MCCNRVRIRVKQQMQSIKRQAYADFANLGRGAGDCSGMGWTLSGYVEGTIEIGLQNMLYSWSCWGLLLMNTQIYIRGTAILFLSCSWKSLSTITYQARCHWTALAPEDLSARFGTSFYIVVFPVYTRRIYYITYKISKDFTIDTHLYTYLYIYIYIHIYGKHTYIWKRTSGLVG